MKKKEYILAHGIKTIFYSRLEYLLYTCAIGKDLKSNEKQIIKDDVKCMKKVEFRYGLVMLLEI